MKASANLIESLSDIGRVETTGQVRRIGSEMLLALARREISAADVDAAAKMVAAISLNMHTEVRLALAAADLRGKGVQLAEVARLGQARIDGAPTAPAVLVQSGPDAAVS